MQYKTTRQKRIRQDEAGRDNTRQDNAKTRQEITQ